MYSFFFSKGISFICSLSTKVPNNTHVTSPIPHLRCGNSLPPATFHGLHLPHLTYCSLAQYARDANQYVSLALQRYSLIVILPHLSFQERKKKHTIVSLSPSSPLLIRQDLRQVDLLKSLSSRSYQARHRRPRRIQNTQPTSSQLTWLQCGLYNVTQDI